MKKISVFLNRAQCDVFLSLLRANDIEYVLKSDDASGAMPQLDLSGGIEVWVSDEDEALAMTLLQSGE